MLTAQSVRHEPLDEGEKGDKRLRRIGKNQSRGDDIDIYTDAFATCLSVGALPNADRFHARFSMSRV